MCLLSSCIICDAISNLFWIMMHTFYVRGFLKIICHRLIFYQKLQAMLKEALINQMTGKANNNTFVYKACRLSQILYLAMQLEKLHAK